MLIPAVVGIVLGLGKEIVAEARTLLGIKPSGPPLPPPKKVPVTKPRSNSGGAGMRLARITPAMISESAIGYTPIGFHTLTLGESITSVATQMGVPPAVLRAWNKGVPDVPILPGMPTYRIRIVDAVSRIN